MALGGFTLASLKNRAGRGRSGEGGVRWRIRRMQQCALAKSSKTNILSLCLPPQHPLGPWPKSSMTWEFISEEQDEIVRTDGSL